jgi:hypothetical protein
MALAQRPTFADPAYATRLSYSDQVAAGSGAVTEKWVAHANLLLYDLTTSLLVAGTSTYTNTVTGTGTNFINGHQLSVITIVPAVPFGTTSVSLSTNTYGPFLSGGSFASGGTMTGQVGGASQFALNTTAGTAGYGGIPVPAGSIFYVVSGTDATAQSSATIGFQINTGAGLTV